MTNHNQTSQQGNTEGTASAPPANQTREGGYEAHEYAMLIPERSTEEYGRLRDDIHCHGLQKPEILFEGKILDGRLRARACAELGIPVACKTLAEFDPLLFTLYGNLRRRNLSPAAPDDFLRRRSAMRQMRHFGV